MFQALLCLQAVLWDMDTLTMKSTMDEHSLLITDVALQRNLHAPRHLLLQEAPCASGTPRTSDMYVLYSVCCTVLCTVCAVQNCMCCTVLYVLYCIGCMGPLAACACNGHAHTHTPTYDTQTWESSSCSKRYDLFLLFFLLFFPFFFVSLACLLLLPVQSAFSPSNPASVRTFTGHTTSVVSLDFHPKEENLLCSCERRRRSGTGVWTGKSAHARSGTPLESQASQNSDTAGCA